MAWALAALVVISGIVIFLEALILVVVKDNTKEDTEKLNRPDLIEIDKK
ncbi:hypothetical protein G8T60_12020 [Clostridium botulinum C]|nr:MULTISPECIES: hypothetical protein [Clostridium]MCD3206792.1 hypothetical protein [Clostridium botulinum C]MCD3209553.1 hypothetical protein [Clostridium botulinum C]MCD3226592.1 hypothetical protein [Clostridium botulinum C]MCD3249025.1 hypothetical protein [Clostridium botulinum C]MCD3257445.1 hypothetical protein [Clostridium botulinum C]